MTQPLVKRAWDAGDLLLALMVPETVLIVAFHATGNSVWLDAAVAGFALLGALFAVRLIIGVVRRARSEQP